MCAGVRVTGTTQTGHLVVSLFHLPPDPIGCHALQCWAGLPCDPLDKVWRIIVAMGVVPGE